jgi:hypothetical protein
MDTSAIRRTTVAVTVASLTLLVSACGGGKDAAGGEKGRADTAEATQSAAAPAAKALTAAELKKAVLVQGDVKDHKIGSPGPEDIVAKSAITVDKPVCAPISYMGSGLAIGSPVATVQRKITSVPKKPQNAKSSDDLMAAFDVTMTFVSLSSYDDKGAEDTLDTIRRSAAACAGGFSGTTVDQKDKITAIKEEKATGGDEAAAWTVTREEDGDSVPFKMVVVRKGTTLASFVSINMAAAATGEATPLPTALLDAQLAKLA